MEDVLIIVAIIVTAIWIIGSFINNGARSNTPMPESIVNGCGAVMIIFILLAIKSCLS